MYPVQAPVIDVILAPVLFVDGSVVEAVNHAVNSQHVRLVGRHCPLRLYDHRRAPWHKSQSISMLDELRQKCGNEQNGKKKSVAAAGCVVGWTTHGQRRKAG